MELSRDPADRKCASYLILIPKREIGVSLLIFRSVRQGLSHGLSTERNGRAFTSMLAEVEH